MTVERLGQATEKLLKQLIEYLGGESGGSDAMLQQFRKLKAEAGNSRMAEQLGLNQAELEDFSKMMRDLEYREGDSDLDDRNHRIVQLRFISWMETLSLRNPALELTEDVEALISEELGRKQVRALELIIRSLVNERFGDQASLEEGLKALLSTPVVEKWKRTADVDDLLSGTTFSELASLFVNSSEYPHYSPLFEESSFLTYLRDKRKTIASFLEDIRRIRNTLSHNKRISNSQLSLMDLYYEELVTPIQQAHDQGQTGVNPDAYLDVGKDELDAWFGGLKEDVNAVREELGDFRRSVESSLGGIASTTADIQQSTGSIGSRQKTIGIGVAAALGALAVVLWLLFGGKEERSEIRGTTERIEQNQQEQAETAKQTKEEILASTEATKETTENILDKTEAAHETSKEILKSTETTEKTTKEILDSTQASHETTKEILETTKSMATSLESMQEGFTTLSRQGGVIADPKRPDQLYHNARVYELRGDYLNARKSYEAFFASGLPVIDPQFRYLEILKAQEGSAGAAASFGKVPPTENTTLNETLKSLTLPDSWRDKALKKITDTDPDFAPAHYLLAEQYSAKQLGQQSLSNKRDEKAALENFLTQVRAGNLQKFFIDKELAGDWVKDAETRLRTLSIVETTPSKPPFVYTAMRSNQGWQLNFNFAEAVRAFSYRLEGQTSFTETGFNDFIDQRLGDRSAKTWFQLPATQRDTTIYVKYRDINNQENGPYEVRFSVTSELVQTQIKTLGMTKGSWVAFNRSNPGLLYFTHLQSYRCAISEVMYGLDTPVPDTRFDGMGACDLADPHRIDPNSKIYIQIPPSTSSVSVQLVYRDGTKSPVEIIQRR